MVSLAGHRHPLDPPSGLNHLQSGSSPTQVRICHPYPWPPEGSSFLSLFVYKNIHHAYSRMLLFLPLFIKCPTVSYMRLAFLYHHVVQPYSMYLYTGISHVVRNIKYALHTLLTPRSNIL